DLAFAIFGQDSLKDADHGISIEFGPKSPVNWGSAKHFNGPSSIKVSHFIDAHSPPQAGSDNRARACPGDIVKIISQQQLGVACSCPEKRFDARENFDGKDTANPASVQSK